MTDVTVTDNPETRRFETTVDGRLAIAEYRLIAGAMLFPHTEVPKELGGRGIGQALVRASLKAARERGLTVLPVCPFFAAYFGKHPEERDLLHPSYKTAMGL